jgi:Spy/CpxP family protein refolding chaperone
MSTSDNTPTTPTDTTRASTPPGASWLNTSLVALGATVVLVGGFGIARASGVGPALMCHRHSRAMAHDFVEFRVAKALDKVGASDAQKQQIKAIVEAEFAKHQAMALAHEDLHRQLLAALGGETVDRAAIETARAQAIAKIDEGSKDLARTVGDIAEVLTPAQRSQLAQLHHKDPK